MDDADLNNSLSILQPEFRLLDAGLDCFLGKMDNIAIYDDDVCPEQLYNNYKTCFPLLTNLEPVANYCYDYTNCDLSLITSIPTTPLTGAMNPNDFPENYTINTAPLSDGDLIDYINSTCSCNSSDPNWFVELDDFLQNSYDAQFTGVALPLDQLKSFPLPRYFPGHLFRQNVNFMGVNYLGFSGYPEMDTLIQFLTLHLMLHLCTAQIFKKNLLKAGITPLWFVKIPQLIQILLHKNG